MKCRLSSSYENDSYHLFVTLMFNLMIKHFVLISYYAKLYTISVYENFWLQSKIFLAKTMLSWNIT